MKHEVIDKSTGNVVATFSTIQQAQKYVERETFKDIEKYSFDLAYLSTYGKLPDRQGYIDHEMTTRLNRNKE